jgi:hypothetical protein
MSIDTTPTIEWLNQHVFHGDDDEEVHIQCCADEFIALCGERLDGMEKFPTTVMATCVQCSYFEHFDFDHCPRGLVCPR